MPLCNFGSQILGIPKPDEFFQAKCVFRIEMLAIGINAESQKILNKLPGLGRFATVPLDRSAQLTSLL